jgi:hypothetical protein
MPLVNNICAPYICVEATFRTGLAKLIGTSGTVTKDFTDTDLGKAELKKFDKPVKIDCDECVCLKWKTKQQWIALSPVNILNPEDPAGKWIAEGKEWTFQITGMSYRMEMGQCLPKGTKIKKADGTWVPVEDMG